MSSFSGVTWGPTDPNYQPAHDYAHGHWEYASGVPLGASMPNFLKEMNTLMTWVPDAYTTAPASTPQASLVPPTIDPKIDANQLYSKPMTLYTGGYARIGSASAPIVGPYFNGDIVEFVVSFGVPSNPAGDRKVYKIYLDQELAWSSASGGTLPAHGTFASQEFDFVFKAGTLTQSAVSIESERFPGDECAYRPQMIMQIRNLPWARFVEKTGKPVPYVAAEIGDVTDGADPLDGINLGEALERIAFSPWAGHQDTFESVGITDVVDAILIKDNFNIVQLCQNVSGEYRNIDVLLSDKIRVKDRGANVSPDFEFDRDSIIGGDAALSVARGNATAQRREHELYAIDPDQDYTAVPSLAKIPRDPMVISAAVGKASATIPLVIDANTRQALATFSQNYDENARRKISFKVPVAGYGIEPGDLFAVRDIALGFDNEIFKCTGTTHGANWVADIEGEAILRCRIFGGTDEGGTFVSGDVCCYLRQAAVDGLTTDQDWQGLGSLDFTNTGHCLSSTYAKISGVPTFLVGGSTGSTGAFGMIMISHDGINWAPVFTHAQSVPEMVWSPDENMFFALVGGTLTFASPDGYTWTEHDSDFYDHTADGFGDGYAGYDPLNDVTFWPHEMDLDFMIVSCTAFAGGLWMAGGVLPSGVGSATATSIDGGASWVLVSTGAIGASANFRVTTMVAATASDM